MVLVEGQTEITLGRIVETTAPIRFSDDAPDQLRTLDVSGSIAVVQLLGTVQPDSGAVSAGVDTYPRIGDRVFSAPLEFVSKIPALLGPADQSSPITLNIGTIAGQTNTEIHIRPEKLFGRHCAILGATGGGKSWTVSRLVEECVKHRAQLLLLDATGEYRSFDGEHVVHHHVGKPTNKSTSSSECGIPPTAFQESDFIAMFEPSGKSQGPKLKEALKSLRLAQALGAHPIVTDGVIYKMGRTRSAIDHQFKVKAELIENPETPFNAMLLAKQLMEECVHPDERGNYEKFGAYAENEKSFCLSLATRIYAITRSIAFAPVFQSEAPSIANALTDFLANTQKKLMRVCLSGISFEYRARQLIVNALGRTLLSKARAGAFEKRPLVVILDEAHNFLGQSVGGEESAARLDAFELIAREGRKYGLNLCLATQRPRDLTEGVLSQMGTLIVHRLTNDRDREIVERASGEIDRAATSFLANLRPGEATLVGVDFPIPLTIQIAEPTHRPLSDGPDYQAAWRPLARPIG
ncbi:MAG: ATP-binding protein [Archangium sp.]